MGVRGLTTFVEENEEDICDVHYLHDCQLVIDGHGLMFWLAGKTVQPRSILNQEYASFAVTVRSFFNGLRQCGVKPMVVFDGPAMAEKYDKVLRTLKGNVMAIDGMFHGDDEEYKGTQLLPPFSVDAIMQLMVELDIPFASSLEDADSEVAALANFLNCPVLAADSDYYIFDLNQGYISLDDMPVSADEGEKELRCLRFSASKFCQKYHISQRKLPFLSIILGNDWVVSAVFSQKVFDISRFFRVDRRDKLWRVKTALLWLSQIESKSDEAVLQELYASMPGSPEKPDNIAKVDYSMNLYRNLPDVSKLYEVLTQNIVDLTKRSSLEKPPSVEGAIREGFVHFSAYHLIKYSFSGLPSAIVCDTHKQSPHLPSVEIRDFVYRSLLRRFCLASEGAKVLVIEEYDFAGPTYKKTRGVNIYTSTCPSCDQRHLFEQPCKSPADAVICNVKFHTVLSKFLSKEFQLFQSFCDEVLKSAIAEMPANFGQRVDIVMMATYYWLKKTSPSPLCVACLLLTLTYFVRRYVERKKGRKPTVSSITQSSESRSFKEKNSNDDAEQKKGESGASNASSGTENGTSQKSKPIVVQNISLRPTWYHRKLALQNLKEAVNATEKQRLNPPAHDDSTLKADPKNLSQYINLLGPAAPNASRRELMFWWTLQEDFVTDMDLLHSIAEWQCTLWAVLLLHQAVEYNCLHLGLYDIYGSNLTLHEVHSRLTKSGKLSEEDLSDLTLCLDKVASVLDVSPSRKSMFQAMAHFLLQ